MCLGYKREITFIFVSLFLYFSSLSDDNYQVSQGTSCTTFESEDSHFNHLLVPPCTRCLAAGTGLGQVLTSWTTDCLDPGLLLWSPEPMEPGRKEGTNTAAAPSAQWPLMLSPVGWGPGERKHRVWTTKHCSAKEAGNSQFLVEDRRATPPPGQACL